MLEGDVGFGCYFEDFVKGDSLTGECIQRDSLLFSIRDIVDQYSTASNALFGPEPNSNARGVTVDNFFCGCTTVEDSTIGVFGCWGGLIVMAKSIPLG